MSDPGWHERATVYSLDVKTFRDSDGDGWGDFRGVVERLDYLDDLGVDCLWLRPFYPSPLRDNGYDVADYYAVDDRLGDLEDFRALAERAHDRGIKLLTDLVFNHTSIDHEWFRRAREDPDSEYHDYYCWTDHPGDAYETVNIFPDREDGVWSYDERAGKHYFHQFYSHQPDLNVANPAVRDEIRDVLRFWIEQGADGFRIDAAHPMLQPKGHHGTTPEGDGIWIFEEMRRDVRSVKGDAILLAEADDRPHELRDYFGGGEAFDLLFNFVSNAHMVYGIGVRDTWPLHRADEVLPDVSEVGGWANFLRNHDEWNLLKLPQEALEHGREFFREFDDGDVDGETDSWIFGRGHRLRLADLLDGDRDRIEMAHSLLLSQPGTPVLQSGDEIGMGADLSLPERESVRTPMHWSGGDNAGFSEAPAEELYNPVIGDGEYGHERVNVADQREDPDSLLSGVRELIAARDRCPTIPGGHRTLVDSGHADVSLHRVDDGDRTITCAHNLADDYRESVRGFEAEEAERVVGDGGFHVEDGGITFLLDPHDYVWLRAEGGVF